MQAQLSDANNRLSHLQSFRTSVARTLHLRDLPETDLLHRLQALCSAHQEFTLLSRRYESASPVGDHPCPRYDEDPIPPTSHCRPPTMHRTLSPSIGHLHSRHHQTHHRPRSKSSGAGKHCGGGGDCSDNNHRRHQFSSGTDDYGIFDDDFGFKGKY